MGFEKESFELSLLFLFHNSHSLRIFCYASFVLIDHVELLLQAFPIVACRQCFQCVQCFQLGFLLAHGFAPLSQAGQDFFGQSTISDLASLEL